MRPCVATALAASFVLCQLALVVFVFNAHDTDTRRGLLETGNQTLTAAQIERLLSTVEELKGTTEAQQATIAELQRNCGGGAAEGAETERQGPERHRNRTTHHPHRADKDVLRDHLGLQRAARGGEAAPVLVAQELHLRE